MREFGVPLTTTVRYQVDSPERSQRQGRFVRKVGAFLTWGNASNSTDKTGFLYPYGVSVQFPNLSYGLWE